MDIKEVQEKVVAFRNERDWEQFHNPKDLAMSLSIESSELLECFQWKNAGQVIDMINDGVGEEVTDEIADIGLYLLLLCESMDIDLIDVMLGKIEKNGIKYPVDKAKGNSKKYTEL